MNNSRHDTRAIMGQLKDFQQRTVEHVFHRMYTAPDCTRRFLVADEVGLGKTLVARGLIAKTIDHLWDRTERIDIVYVCSNSDIARQNISKLNISGQQDFALSSRITMLPTTVSGMQSRKVNFVSFTPSTSFELKGSAGRTEERELLYWLLADPWNLSFAKATRVFQGYAGIDGFRERVRQFPSRFTIHPEIKQQFTESVGHCPQLRARFDSLCDVMPRAGAQVPSEIVLQRNELVGDLRRALAQTCLHWLEPDLIILDEFQRFKHLLGGHAGEAGEAAELAEHLFSFQASSDDPATAARVLLLSATPYKMYTLQREAEQDDHYQDLLGTLSFLCSDDQERKQLEHAIAAYRDGLYRLADGGADALLAAKHELEQSLRKVMVRTERLGLRTNRDGMLAEPQPDGVTVTPSDVRQYLALQQVARSLNHDDVLEYWKSAPYLLNFMDDYDLKRKLKSALDSPDRNSDAVRAAREAGPALLDRNALEAYQRLDPANARLRALHADVIGREAWRLLWIPASQPYYQGSGPFADPGLAAFTKRLVFSCWRVVPKAIASVLSYEAERCMLHTFRRKVRNTVDARKRRRPLLRFTFSKERPTGMPALGLVYPSRTLAERFDPLREFIDNRTDGLPSLRVLQRGIHAELEQLLAPVIAKRGDHSAPADERWYWAAPLLLDQEYDAERFRDWFSRPDLPNRWAGESSGGGETFADGWARHIDHARGVVLSDHKFGCPPDDLAEALALLTIAGPGVASLRALKRAVGQGSCGQALDLRDSAAPLAYAFLHLFNLPEVMYLLRDRRREEPYWRSVLSYCAAGNLQAVLDEYAHMLVESRGLTGHAPAEAAEELSSEMGRCLALRTATAKADMLAIAGRSARFDEPLRMRTRFAMRFGDQEPEGTAEPTRADHVRSAFNSPFWPFVLATTSVGQEGLDFHPYCHAVVHWNLPSNPVDLEQREGRVQRYKGHAVRKNLAARYAHAVPSETTDLWHAMFDNARATRPDGQTDLFPYWVAPDGAAKIQRHLLTIPHSREVQREADLRRSLVLYRMVFGQNRQEDLVSYLLTQLPAAEIEHLMERCRIDLSPGRSGDVTEQWTTQSVSLSPRSPGVPTGTQKQS